MKTKLDIFAQPLYVVAVDVSPNEFSFIEEFCISKYEDDSADAICWLNSDYEENVLEDVCKAINSYTKLREACKIALSEMQNPGKISTLALINILKDALK